MKNFTSTAVMAIFVAGLAGYTLYEYRNATEDAMEAQGETKPFLMDRTQIREVRLETQGRKTVLRKEGEAWKLVEPVQDEGETATIDGFLYTLQIQKLKSFRTEDEAKSTALAEFGLDPAPHKIEISDGKKSELILVSDKKAFDGKSFVLFQDQVWLGDPGLPQQAQREPNSFRTRKIWRDEGEIEGVKVSMDWNGRKESFHLRFKDKWLVESSAPFPIDSDKVRNWLDLVRSPAISDFASEQVSEASKKEFWLTKPTYTVELELKPKEGVKNWTVTFGQDRGDAVYLYSNSRNFIYKSEIKNINGLRLPLEYFRDGKSPFQFPLEQAKTIETRFDQKILKFEKNESTWAVKNSASDEELNQENLVAFMQNLKNLEATEFLKGPAKGLPSIPQVLVKDEKGETLFSIAWGSEYKSQSPDNKGMTLVFVKTNNEKSALGLPKDKLLALAEQNLIQKKAPAKGSEAK